MQRRSFYVACAVITMIYPPRISAFVDKNDRKIVKNVSIVLFNNQVKAFKHDGHIFTFRYDMLASFIQNNEALKVISVEAKIIISALLQAEYFVINNLDVLKSG